MKAGQSHLLDIKNNQLEHIVEWVANKLKRGILIEEMSIVQFSVETYPVMSIAEHCGRLTDPRMEKRVDHRLLDIILIGMVESECNTRREGYGGKALLYLEPGQSSCAFRARRARALGH
jgi:hypothetical protein